MFFTILLALAFWCRVALGITVTTSTSSYTVDTGSSYGFSVAISRTSCDITSVVFYGTDYQYSGTKSHIASGLGTATVSYSTTGDYVIVKCVADNADFDLTHYMVFKDGDASIYMGTYTVSEPSIGELRFIFRLTGLTDMYPAYSYGNVANTAGGTAIEGSDVYLVSGQTRSKFYSSNRFIDDTTYCATNSAVHACWLRPSIGSVEKSSGGPFFRDIDINWTGDYNSLTYYMNSGHVQTEAYRQGFHGPYVFAMTRSGIPSPSSYDVSFFDDISSYLTGYVPTSSRGYVAGKATGTDASKGIVLHWYNANYQGWAYASASTGDFSGPLLPTGTYTMNLYQGELLAASKSVTITTGAVTSNIAATNTIITGSRTKIFQLGDYDGQPLGFLNADKQLRMHPSDSRMSSWTPGSIVATASTATAQFPMALFKANGAQTLTFTLSSALNVASYFRTATTLSFAGGRPLVTINSYSCGTPAAPTTIDSRGVTRGAYRGWGDVYTCTIPAGTLVAGTNTITIGIASGSSGDAFLSPNVSFDALELYY
ncbi:hypothetical protein N0V82_008885 [Gnomoniopsis sp. IMI 355080]|nr:hypothetical protein N0V82_008885 [Gnomoniopsis sp. IMI 355080]